MKNIIFRQSVIALLFITAQIQAADVETNFYLKDLPFAAPEVNIPVFAADTFLVTGFGALGDGQAINTLAFEKAINTCSGNGGGVVLVPNGIWLTGPIKFKNNVNLHLQRGALLLFSNKFEDYPLIRNTWEGLEEVRCLAPISGFDLTNIAITGEGVIDGAGDAWRPVKRFKMTDSQWKELLKSGGALSADGKVWWPSEGARDGADLVKSLNSKGDAAIADYAAAREYLRPVLVNFVNCKNILLDGPTFQNSPAWNIHPLMCENLIVRNVTVRNPWYSQNGDGIDIESCKNALIYNSSFDVGDDAICIKSGKNEYGRKRGKPSENIVIANCVVYHGHGGFTIGSEMSGGVKNVYVTDCTFLGTDVGLRFKSTRGRGGIVENIFINNIFMKDIPMEAIRFNMFYENKAPIPEDDEVQKPLFSATPKVPVDEGTPVFRNIDIKNIICKGAGQAVLMQGLPEMPLTGVNLENISIACKKGVVFVEVDQIKFKNLDIRTTGNTSVVLFNSRNITIENPLIYKENDDFLFVSGSESKNISVRNAIGELNQEMITVSQDLSTGIINIQ